MDDIISYICCILCGCHGITRAALQKMACSSQSEVFLSLYVLYVTAEHHSGMHTMTAQTSNRVNFTLYSKYIHVYICLFFVRPWDVQ